MTTRSTKGEEGTGNDPAMRKDLPSCRRFFYRTKAKATQRTKRALHAGRMKELNNGTPSRLWSPKDDTVNIERGTYT